MSGLDLRLDRRVVVVTGAAAGIGLCIARHFIAQGAIVYLTDRDEAALVEAAQALGPNAHAQRMDVTDGAQTEHVAARICAAHEGIDVLVNNAGLVAQGGFAETDDAAWQRLVAVNLGGVFHCVQSIAPRMRERGKGAIVNLASVSAMRGGGSIGNVWYGATKAAIVAITMGLARELGPHGVRANAIAPGAIEASGMVRDAFTDGVRERVLARFPLGRLATTDDVAQLAVFLASDAASFITGQTVAVDGGFLVS